MKRYRPLVAWLAPVIASAGLVAGGIVAIAPAASASSGVNIDASNWSTGVTRCSSYNQYDVYCLWYSPNYANGIWGNANEVVDPIPYDSTGEFTDGDGYVRNNAASMADTSSYCNVTTWVSPNYEGNWNWLYPFDAGNLTSSGSVILRNNEAMIDFNGC